MIEDKNLYDMKLTEQYNSTDKEVYLLVFDKNFEPNIVKELIKYTKNFIVLLTDAISGVNSKTCNKYYCDKENMQIVLSSIFNNEHFEYEFSLSDSNEYSCILFVQENKLDSSYSSYMSRCANFSWLCSKNSKFHFYDFYFYNSVAVVRLSDAIEENKDFDILNISLEGSKIYKKKIMLLTPFFGIGDYFIMFSLIYEYLLRISVNFTEIYLPVICSDKFSMMNCDSYFTGFKKLYFDNECIYNYCLSSSAKNVVSMYNIFRENCYKHFYKSSYKHITSIIRDILDINNDFNIYEHNSVLYKNVVAFLSDDERNYIDSLLLEKEYVGFQFFTGAFDEKTNVWVAETDRFWNETNISKFIDKCEEFGIKILVLNQNPYINSSSMCLKKLSVEGYIYAISKLKLVVGIDSSAGHIASFFNIPNITLWGGQTPFEINIAGTDEYFKVGYRSLRKNISIYSKNFKANDIEPELVVNTIVELLNGKRDLCDEIIDYNTKKNCIEL